MKGVILAGGTGSRLHPLTRITNKHLLPIHDRPMVNFAIEALVNAGIDELMVSLHSASDPEKELSEAFHALGSLSGELRARAPRNAHPEGDTA